MSRPTIQALGLLAFTPLLAATDVRLDDWNYSETSPEAATGGERVRVPHSWNTTDIQSGKGKNQMSKDGYRRAPSWYAVTLPATTPGKRVFVRFGAVSSVAQVALNGTPLGEHRGPASAFAFELTPHLKTDGANTLTVKADNTWREDVAPISGDFGVPGGIYRPVELVEKPPVCLSPLVLGSRGVEVTTLRADKKRAEVKVLAHVDRGVNSPCEVSFRLLDSQGATVATRRVALAQGAGPATAEAVLAVDSPRLWAGIRDPYLYTLETAVTTPAGTRDTGTLNLGLRTITFDKDKGAFLNGEPYPLRGVNRHQDRENHAWAISAEQEREDVAIIREMGANAVRAAHYPHSEVFLDACDRAGLLVWAEAPVIDSVGDHPEVFAENAELQLREMIAQQRHHACVFTWSLFNEIGLRFGGKDATSVIARLNRAAHAADPSRPTAGAAFGGTKKEIRAIPDLMGYNDYPGWYGGGNGSHAGSFRSNRKSMPDKPWAVSEYGAGASIGQQDDAVSKAPGAGGKWHPEAWQTRVHENALKSFADCAPAMWGSFVWNMFDFASPWRHEGERNGINDKGLVTYDRRTRKDAFYLYKANWNPEPMVHLLARRDVARHAESVSIRYYSNLTKVTVKLNDTVLGGAKSYAPNAYVIGPVKLRPGKNTVTAEALAPGGARITDKVEWTFSPKEKAAP